MSCLHPPLENRSVSKHTHVQDVILSDTPAILYTWFKPSNSEEQICNRFNICSLQNTIFLHYYVLTKREEIIRKLRWSCCTTVLIK